LFLVPLTPGFYAGEGRLVDAPSDHEMLAPLAAREIVYRLSRGKQGCAASSSQRWQP
jgi:hypothetical protein